MIQENIPDAYKYYRYRRTFLIQGNILYTGEYSRYIKNIPDTGEYS